MTSSEQGPDRPAPETFDVVIVGAGFAGMYQLYLLREAGFRVVVLDEAGDVGGTWYWNRYPGARCDILTVDYSYSWDPELEKAWNWSERYATQPEILRYARFVADRYDLRRDIRFSTRMAGAQWDDTAHQWIITTEAGAPLAARFLIMASGCLSVPKSPDVPGAERFRGERYFTGRWPQEGVDFSGKRVAVIGTGSSGMQAIPLIAAEAEHLSVFQRTPNFSLPAHNGPIAPERTAPFERDRDSYREAARWSPEGVPRELAEQSALAVSDEERRSAYEAVWQRGELVGFYGAFNDLVTDPAANETISQFLHDKIRAIVQDPDTAERLCPRDFYVGTKRLCLETDYHATFNLPHVELVDLKTDPIETITEHGIQTAQADFDFDAIVFATGFDAMTGALVSVDIQGRDGVTLRERWASGAETYLGLMSVDFPNLFMITGPGSPSVLSNMMLSIEQHVEWISAALAHLREQGYEIMEPTPLAQSRWVQHSNEFADLTLMPTADSWYTGANVPGKARVFLPYIGGVDRYRAACEEVVARDYLGFVLDGPAGRVENDGIIRELKPDVQMMLEAFAAAGLPPIETMGVAGARDFFRQSGEAMPPGPDIGEVRDGVMPAADGSDMAYRLYRPATPGPHPLVVYFHGGGWMLGSHSSDDALCRDLCARSNAIFLSVDYRHAPEAPFPAAADDGTAALRWCAAHAAELGARPDRLAVAGWSAGGNIAAVAAQRARHDGPPLCAQLLLCPVTDCDLTRPSYRDNAEGYVLTTALMAWFWDNYCPPEHRTDPRASPLRADDLSGLPPAVVVTCQFDPLRDEGDAYASALTAAGVPVHHLPCAGHIHSSLGAVGVVVSGASVRAAIADALQPLLAEEESRAAAG